MAKRTACGSRGRVALESGKIQPLGEDASNARNLIHSRKETTAQQRVLVATGWFTAVMDRVGWEPCWAHVRRRSVDVCLLYILAIGKFADTYPLTGRDSVARSKLPEL